MVNNITISQESLREQLKIINSAIAEEMYNVGQKQNLLMRKAAIRFLIIVKQNEERMKQIQERARILKQLRSTLNFKKGVAPNEQALKKYNDEKAKIQIEQLQQGQFQNFFQQVMTFNETILSILQGEQLISVVVENSNKQPVILDLTLQEFFKLGGIIKEDITSTGKLTGRINLTAISAQTNLRNALEGDTVLDNNSLNALTETYIIAKKDYNTHSPYAFWKINVTDRWHGIKIAGGQGDIAQAYSMFAHTYGPHTSKFDNFYQNLDTFFREGVAQVDNISGLYTSDVTVNGYSLAVKAANASLPGFTQMIQLANKIVTNEVSSIDQLKNLAKKRKGLNEEGIKTNLKFGLRNKIYESTKQIPKKYQIKINLFNFD